MSNCFMQSGPKNMTEQTQGVNYRALGDLFKLAEQRKGTFIYDIAVQMIEIYNEQVRDLLVTDGLNKRYPLCSHISVKLYQFFMSLSYVVLPKELYFLNEYIHWRYEITLRMGSMCRMQALSVWRQQWMSWN